MFFLPLKNSCTNIKNICLCRTCNKNNNMKNHKSSENFTINNNNNTIPSTDGPNKTTNLNLNGHGTNNGHMENNNVDTQKFSLKYPEFCCFHFFRKKPKKIAEIVNDIGILECRSTEPNNCDGENNVTPVIPITNAPDAYVYTTLILNEFF